ncbi:MAG TPA: SIMPL domain-containing protein [Candidatus Cloacimonadota bacterium]|nr:SIMPL domain-containing protein [Candidatus Cloacimonadota bacterium]HPM00921.1 SIMPL domain-containing protein [Candidatus Cloacimonadota bacterium]
MDKTIGIAIIIAALIFGTFFYKAQHEKESVKVVGYASMHHPSDILKWQVTIGTQAGTNQMKTAYRDLNQNVEFFRNLLKENNLSLSELTINSPFSYPVYDQSGLIKSYNIEQNLVYTVKDTTLFQVIENLNNNPEGLYAKGLLLRNSQIQYFISELPKLKHNIIAEATKDAKQRAEEVAKSSKDKVGKLLNARVGVFQITEPYSTEVQAYGVYNVSTKQKQISVTVTAEYELK